MKKRIFIGIEISEGAKKRTAQYVGELRKEFSDLRVGWEQSEKLHLTLKFLGEIAEQEITKLKNAVEETARRFSSFKLQIAETGVFPKAAKAKVLWIDVKNEEGTLVELHSVFENECEKQGFERESRNFKPHLTIARLREPENSRELVEKHLHKKFEPVEFEVSEIVIFQSVLQSTGSIYSKIGSAKLMDD